MKHKEKSRLNIIFFQALICILVISSCICINAIKQKSSVSAGTFTNNARYTNCSFSDLAQTLENKFIEKSTHYAH